MERESNGESGWNIHPFSSPFFTSFPAPELPISLGRVTIYITYISKVSWGRRGIRRSLSLVIINSGGATYTKSSSWLPKMLRRYRHTPYGTGLSGSLRTGSFFISIQQRG